MGGGIYALCERGRVCANRAGGRAPGATFCVRANENRESVNIRPATPHTGNQCLTGGDPFGGAVISSGANACRESPVAATRAHLASQRKDQWLSNISSRGHEIVENGKESRDYEHSPSMLPSASGRRSSRRSGPEVSARTHARRVLSPPPVRIWPRKGRTSGSRITAAEDKKLMKTVRSHAIPSTPIRCFRMPLGDDLLGGSGLGSPRERQSREC